MRLKNNNKMNIDIVGICIGGNYLYFLTHLKELNVTAD
jgi:hypothetical protein